MKKSKVSKVLVLAGFDPSGKAGILRDAQVIRHLGSYPVAIPAALTAQNFQINDGFIPVDSDFFEKMLMTLLDKNPPDGVKIGMIPDEKTASIVKKFFIDANIPIVYDPVLSSSDGKPLMFKQQERQIFEKIAEIATIITPNIPEAEFFFKIRRHSHNFFDECTKICKSYDVSGMVIKGGHDRGNDITDVLVLADGTLRKYRRKRLDKNIRGTGCMFSSALAKYLADGFSIEDAFLYAEKSMDDMLSSDDFNLHLSSLRASS